MQLTTFFALSGFFNGVTSFVLGVIVLLKNRRRNVNQIYFLFNLSITFWSIGYIFWPLSHTRESTLFWFQILHYGAVFIPVTYYHFVLMLTEQLVKRRQSLTIGYLLALFFALLIPSRFFIRDMVPKFALEFWAVPGVLYHFFLLCFFTYVIMSLTLLWKEMARSGGRKRDQYRHVFLATLIGYAGGSTNYPLWYGIPIYPVGNILVTLYVGIIAYAIVRYRLMDINLVVTRTAVFAMVYALVLGLPLGAALIWQTQLERLLGPRWWVWMWLVGAFLTTAAHYVNLYLQQKAEERLLAQQRRYQETLRQAAKGMTLVKDMGRLLNLVVHILTRTVKVGHASVWLLDRETDHFILRGMRGHNGVQLNDVIEGKHPLIGYLHKVKESVVEEELRLMTQGGGMEELKPVVDEMARIGAAVIIPSIVEDKLLGFLVMSEKKSGQMYSTDDLRVFQVLASQAALAIENAQFYEDLKETQAELFQTAKLASLGQMAGGMSHQINNRFYVLTILAGTLRAALEQIKVGDAVTPELNALLERTRETMTKIEDNAIRGGDIVKTLLRFSRPGKVEAKPITPQEIVAAARDVAQYKADLSSIDFVQEWPANLPEVNGNLNQLADCFFNLITNAYDAIQAKIEKSKPLDYRGRITISGHPAVDGRVSIDIVDNGIGMNRQEMDQLFVPFFTTKATAEKGTGLGLFVIKRILEHHGGSIAVQSSPGQGTTFTIFLPAVASQGGQGGVVRIG